MSNALRWIAENVDVLTFCLALFGGMVALIQWGQQIRQHRVEKVKELIYKIRDDNEITIIFDIIDWNKGIVYDGTFHLAQNEKYIIDDDCLFRIIDKTLIHFNYICYLKRSHAFVNKDMAIFEYELRRLTDNQSIVNYLYSIYHGSTHLGVRCTFQYLIEYSLCKGYLDKEFVENRTQKYKCYLEFTEDNTDRKRRDAFTRLYSVIVCRFNTIRMFNAGKVKK